MRQTRRIVIGLGAFSALSFIVGVLLAVFDPAEVSVSSHDADTFSRSAIGHRGLARWLRALGVPVVISRVGTAGKATANTVLLVLEPPGDAQHDRLSRLLDDAASETIVVALPKWTGVVSTGRDDWISGVEPVADAHRDAVLKAMGLESRSTAADAGEWRWLDGPSPSPISLRSPRGLDGAGLEPLLTRGDHTLIGETRRGSTRLVVISDPDLLANAGLVRHAELLSALFGSTLGIDPGRHAVVIDETLHGHVSTASLARQLFEFPLAAVTWQALAVGVLAILAGVRRFGSVSDRPAGFERGRRALVENTAALAHHAGHDAAALTGYWSAVRDATARTLGAPAGLEGDDRLAWLARAGSLRSVTENPHALAEGARDAHALRPASRIALARRIHRWRS